MSEDLQNRPRKEPLLPAWIWRICLGFLVLMTMIDIASGLFCSNAISYSQPSPDGKLTAVVFMRHCGSTSGHSPHVSILEHSDAIRESDSGNVFIAGDKEPAQLSLRWKDPSTLVVTRDPSVVIFKESKWVAIWKFPLPQFVSVEYQDSAL